MTVAIEYAVSEFIRAFPAVNCADGLWIARAPGRVNLIGEHTDYSEGFVLPAAIDRDIVIVFHPRSDLDVRLYSGDYDERSEFGLDDIVRDDANPWSNYFRGAAKALCDSDICRSLGLMSFAGLDAVIIGDIPRESGLSSSAALEVASAFALLTSSGALPHQLGHECTELRKEIALACQRAENVFVGVGCGIMDQMASVMGRRSHAVFLDCRSLEHQLIPVMLDENDVALVVYDTGVRRELVGSGYNLRRAELEEGTNLIANALNRPDIATLRDVTPDDFEAVRKLLSPTVARRCEHVIKENDRVLKAVNALCAGNMVEFGELMYESHVSLQSFYEVSCPELDRAVAAAQNVRGVIGARMTGAGFGGCTVNLVERQSVELLIAELTQSCGFKSSCSETETQYAQAFVVKPANGASIEKISPHMVQAVRDRQ